MTPDSVLAALALPPQAMVDRRIAKKLLLENGAPTATDKRYINEGVEEIAWVAALKPGTVGVPAYKDEVREYLEIAVLTLSLREGAKGGRLCELVHRAIPYPVVLVTQDEDGVSLSLAHIRHAENEAGKTVLDGTTARANVTDDAPGMAFLGSLAVAGLRRDDLRAVYQDWIDRIDALAAARVTGSFRVCATRAAADRRRVLLREFAEVDGRVGALTTEAGAERQLTRRIELNLKLRTLKDERARLCDALAAEADA
jgi:hypothetical protein